MASCKKTMKKIKIYLISFRFAIKVVYLQCVSKEMQ